MVRDRLYCDRVGSEKHLQAQFTLDVIGTGLIQLLAPMLPHLSAEFITHHPCLKSQLQNAMQHLLTSPSTPHDLLVDENVDQAIEYTQQLRSQLVESSKNKLHLQKTVILILLYFIDLFSYFRLF